MPDVLVVGAGPAGATAALVLARAGVRVTLVDRAQFPRPKLCGDTLNPGTLAILDRLGIVSAVTDRGLPIRGMRLTGPRGVSVEAEYGPGTTGIAQRRCDFDHRLLFEAMAAGAQFEPGLRVDAPLVAHLPHPVVTGVSTRRSGRAACRLDAPVTIAADGRRSGLALAMGLARQPASPRRWAIGAYYEGIAGLGAFGEMHVRTGSYLGVAPLPGGFANVILVVPSKGIREWQGRASDRQEVFASLLDHAIESDPSLSDRFASARRVSALTVLGPMAVDVRSPAVPGLLLAGDAAGFIDPITGDGIRFAIRGGELAAEAALRALANGWTGVAEEYADARRAAFGSKWRFNRGVRRLTGSAAAIQGIAAVAPMVPPLLRWAVRYAGDCVAG